MPHARIPVIPLASRRAYSPAEVAAVTGFSLSFIYELIKSGALRSRKVAGRRIVTAEALDELLGEASSTEIPAQAIAREHLAAARTPARCEPSSALAADTVTASVRRRERSRRARAEGSLS